MVLPFRDHQFPSAWSAFTLIEVIVVVFVSSMLIGLAVPGSVSLYRRYLLRADRDVVIAYLEQARDQSLANLHETAHGVKITNTNYILFEGTSYANRNTSQDLVTKRSLPVIPQGEIVFQPVSGRTTATTLNGTSAEGTVALSVTAEGMIDW